MTPDADEPRYTPDELFGRYFDFLKDGQARLQKGEYAPGNMRSYYCGSLPM